MKQILDLSSRRISSIDHIFVLAPQEDLTSDCHLRTLFVAYWTGRLFLIVEYDRHTRFIDSRLPLFVDKLRQIPRTNLTEIGDSQHEANRIENVGLSGTVQPSNGIEVGVETEVEEVELY